MSTFFPPFDPDDDEAPPRRRRSFRGMVPVRTILPNLITLLALCAGLTAIRMAIEGRFDYAIAAILVAGLLDGLDGRIARILKSTTRFGAELDSLTDFVNFGVAPVMILFVWTLDDLRSVGWIAALIFAICAALRLARFNTALDGPDQPDWQVNYFIGVPAPAGAGLVLLPLYADFLGVPYGVWTAPIVLIYTVAIGVLMISRLPTWSGKRLGRRISRDLVLPIFVAVVLSAALLLSFPWLVLTLAALLYLAMLPIGWNTWQRRYRADLVAARARDDVPEAENEG